MTKLTKRMVESLEIKNKDYFVWETELSGFGVRVFPTVRIKFVLQYRHGRISRRMSLGQFGALSVDQAREPHACTSFTARDPHSQFFWSFVEV